MEALGSEGAAATALPCTHRSRTRSHEESCQGGTRMTLWPSANADRGRRPGAHRAVHAVAPQVADPEDAEGLGRNCGGLAESSVDIGSNRAGRHSPGLRATAASDWSQQPGMRQPQTVVCGMSGAARHQRKPTTCGRRTVNRSADRQLSSSKSAKRNDLVVRTSRDCTHQLPRLVSRRSGDGGTCAVKNSQQVQDRLRVKLIVTASTKDVR